jgi:hypothetical protein
MNIAVIKRGARRKDRLHREIESPRSHRGGTFRELLLIILSRRLGVRLLG